MSDLGMMHLTVEVGALPWWPYLRTEMAAGYVKLGVTTDIRASGYPRPGLRTDMAAEFYTGFSDLNVDFKAKANDDLRTDIKAGKYGTFYYDTE